MTGSPEGPACLHPTPAPGLQMPATPARGLRVFWGLNSSPHAHPAQRLPTEPLLSP